MNPRLIKTVKRGNSAVFLICVSLLAVISMHLVSLPKTDVSAFLKGQFFREIESHYQSVFPEKETITGFWATIHYLLFHEGRDGVVVGKNDWLFSTEEFALSEKYQQYWNQNLEIIASRQRILQKRGIDLLVVLIPEKAVLYQEELQTPSPHEQLGLGEQSLTWLSEKGIPTLDPTAAMKRAIAEDQQIFLRTDTHWTPLGAKLTAQEIARGGYIPLGTASYSAASTGVATLAGDLTSFIPLGKFFARFGPAPDLFEQTTITSSDSGSGALFAEQSIDTAIVGTSYSANEKWRFIDWLQLFLHKEVLNYAQSGHGPVPPMDTFLKDGLTQNTPITHIIWEFPVRYLVRPPYEQQSDNKEK